MGVVARAEVMDRHPLSYLVRVSEEGPATYLAYSWAHLGTVGVAGRHHKGSQGDYYTITPEAPLALRVTH